MTKFVPNEVGERYKFSNYIIDPNKFRFQTIVRILGLGFLFIQKMIFLKKRQFCQEASEGNNGPIYSVPIEC